MTQILPQRQRISFLQPLDLSSSRCLELGIPAHLHWVGRPVDDVFTTTENVFHRIPPSSIRDGKVQPEAIKTTRTSVIRERDTHSPTDALFDGAEGKHCKHFGVATLPVEAIERLEKSLPNADRKFTFKVKHVPMECMYPHCEIHAFENGIWIPEIKPSSVKTWLRIELSKIAVLVRPPGDEQIAPA